MTKKQQIEYITNKLEYDIDKNFILIEYEKFDEVEKLISKVKKRLEKNIIGKMEYANWYDIYHILDNDFIEEGKLMLVNRIKYEALCDLMRANTIMVMKKSGRIKSTNK